MPQRIFTTKLLRVDGMTCANCESRIENELKKIEGISQADARYGSGTLKVVYDGTAVDIASIAKAIGAMGYNVAETDKSGGKTTGAAQILGTGFVIFALYILLNRFGLLSFFNFFPEADAGMGYGMLFIVGLLTSVHCLAMCGGINLSQCLGHRSGETGGRFSSLRPSALYNLGRVVSYTIIGGVVGAFGSLVSFSGNARGIVQLITGVFMIVMGVNMLGVFTFLRKLNPRMPKFFARKIEREKKSNSPLYVGLLNGLMPCGPLQAMQLYALYTGSALQGALSMFVFSLGTVPLMFGLGAFSSAVSKKFTGTMMKAGAVLVVLMGTVMFGNGMNLSGFSVPTATGVPGETAAEAADNVQTVTTELSPYAYAPITVKAGIPVRWTIRAAPGTVNGCNNAMVVPEYNLEKKLRVGDNVVEFTPTKSGVFPYSCWMGMIRSSITVVDGEVSSKNTAAPAASEGLENTTPPVGSGCCTDTPEQETGAIQEVPSPQETRGASCCG